MKKNAAQLVQNNALGNVDINPPEGWYIPPNLFQQQRVSTRSANPFERSENPIVEDRTRKLWAQIP